MRNQILLAALWLLLLCNCLADDVEAPDAALPRCADLPGCETAVCNTGGVCVCNRPGQEPATCTRGGGDVDAGGSP